MKNYIIIYPNTNPNYISELCTSLITINSDNKLNGIEDAINDTPEGYPFLIIESTEYDSMFHDAYSVDFSNPDGYGTNKKILKSLKASGFTDWNTNN
jgi:hypothetical protein